MIFESAIELPVAQRDGFVRKACDGDPVLWNEVSLLRLSEENGRRFFLDEPIPSAVRAEMIALSPMGAIGPYRIIHTLGQGGMGTVYLAERIDGLVQRPVALKVLRYVSASPDLAQRFDSERRILDRLNHTGIARLIDAGVVSPLSDEPQAVAYLAMEYVPGLPITDYCIKNDLSVGQRLELFLQMCKAVQHAHQNLIVHRDLKPSNILVTETASPNSPVIKLLDFGIAKLIQPNPDATELQTRPGQSRMTIAYASPEQFRGEPVATHSDIYALGVLLYELLTDKRPYVLTGLSPGAVEACICEQIPPLPSQVAYTDRMKSLRGDLDTIVMKALHKSPARRYQTVLELHDDIRRHLALIPVRARPDSRLYRAARFVQRHRAGVVACGLILFAVLFGAVATSLQARKAEYRATQVRTLATTLLTDLDLALRDLPGATRARELVAGTALLYLDSLDLGSQDTAWQLERARAYDLLARHQGDPHFDNLGRLSDAMASYQRAYEIRLALWHQDSTNTTYRRALANSLGNLGVMSSWNGKNTEAISLSRQALTVLAPVVLADPSPTVTRDESRLRGELGWWLIWEGRTEEGLRELQQAMITIERLAASNPNDLELQLDLWRNYWYQTDGLKFSSKDTVALNLLQHKAIPHLEQLVVTYPTNPRAQYGLHTAFYFLGELFLAQNDTASARVAFQTSLQTARRMVEADSSNRKAHEGLSFGFRALGHLYRVSGAFEKAIDAYSSDLAIRIRLYHDDPQNQEAANAVSNAFRLLCRTRYASRDFEGAVAPCKEAITWLAPQVDGTSVQGVIWGNLGFNHGWLGMSLAALAEQTAQPAARHQLLLEALNHFDQSHAIMTQYYRQSEGNDAAWEFTMDELVSSRNRVITGLQP